MKFVDIVWNKSRTCLGVLGPDLNNQPVFGGVKTPSDKLWWSNIFPDMFDCEALCLGFFMGRTVPGTHALRQVLDLKGQGMETSLRLICDQSTEFLIEIILLW